MSGFGDTYIPASAIFLGASNFYIGLFTALPQFFGSVFQFFSIEILKFFKNRKFIVLFGSFLHAIFWLFISLIFIINHPFSVEFLLIFFTLGFSITFMINPIWSSWITDIVPESGRVNFFANRNQISQLVLFLSTILAGFLLSKISPPAIAFGLIFFIAFLARLFSVYFHYLTANVNYNLALLKEIKLKHLFLLPSYKNELWFLLFIAAINFSVQFASPFFTPYMLNNLKFDSNIFGIMVAASVFAKILSFPYWGETINRYGVYPILILTSFLTPLIPLLWLLTTDKTLIFLFQIFSGFIWAGFDIASFTFALSIVEKELRPSFISKYNMFSGFFNFFGALAGGFFLEEYKNLNIFGFREILLVFLISGILRIITVIFFAPKFLEKKQTKIDYKTLIFTIIAVRPIEGIVHNVQNGWNKASSLSKKIKK
jgi:MFS family permease